MVTDKIGSEGKDVKSTFSTVPIESSYGLSIGADLDDLE